MTKFNSNKELRKAWMDYTNDQNENLITWSRTSGISAQMQFGVNATIEYVDGFGWAIV